MRATMPARKRPGNLARLFFQPLEPFLVDDIATHRHPGRIARVTLEPVWEWICRDLMPGEAKAVTEQVAAAFERGEAARAEELARALPGPRRDADRGSARRGGRRRKVRRRLVRPDRHAARDR